MRALLAVLMAGSIAAAGLPARAGESLPARVSLSVRNTRLRQAVEALSRGAGRPVTVDPAVPDVPVSVDLQGVPFETALRLLVNTASAQAPGVYSAANGRGFVLRRRPVAPRVDLAVAMRARPPAPEAASGVPTVTISLSAVPF